MTNKEVLVDANNLVRKWLIRFGFGHYESHIRLVPRGQYRNTVWARCVWNHTDEFCVIEVNPQELRNERELETALLHELTHGLIDYANNDEEALERVCNRLPKLLMGKRWAPGNARILKDPKHPCWNSPTCYSYGMRPELKEWVSLFVDGLEPRERRIVEGSIWEGKSMNALADELGVSKRTVGRLRNKAFARIRKLCEELNTFFEQQ